MVVEQAVGPSAMLSQVFLTIFLLDAVGAYPLLCLVVFLHLASFRGGGGWGTCMGCCKWLRVTRCPCYDTWGRVCSSRTFARGSGKSLFVRSTDDALLLLTISPTSVVCLPTSFLSSLPDHSLFVLDNRLGLTSMWPELEEQARQFAEAAEVSYDDLVTTLRTLSTLQKAHDIVYAGLGGIGIDPLYVQEGGLSDLVEKAAWTDPVTVIKTLTTLVNEKGAPKGSRVLASTTSSPGVDVEDFLTHCSVPFVIQDNRVVPKMGRWMLASLARHAAAIKGAEEEANALREKARSTYSFTFAPSLTFKVPLIASIFS